MYIVPDEQFSFPPEPDAHPNRTVPAESLVLKNLKNHIFRFTVYAD